MARLITQTALICVSLLWSAIAALALPNCTSDSFTNFSNCFGSNTFSDGSRYVGEWQYGKPRGHGSLTFADGDRYIGELLDGEYHGQGIYYFASGAVYAGQYRNSKRNGQGTYIFPDGERYVGSYIDDKRNGFGIHTFPDGERYVGEYRDGQRDGYGSHTFPDGETYVGEWRDGNANGYGSASWPDGDTYVGQFLEDEFHGQGTYSSSDGTIQEGIWENGHFRYTNVDDQKVISAAPPQDHTLLEDTSKHGAYSSRLPNCPSNTNVDWSGCFGVYKFSDGDIYAGEWQYNRRHGEGMYIFASGSSYIGEFQNGEYHGKGIYTFHDGENYAGEWTDGKNNGQGTYTFTNGDTYVGQFQNDKLHGIGTYTHASGARYVGEYRNDKRHGQGMYTYADGTIQEGTWEDGAFRNSSRATQIVVDSADDKGGTLVEASSGSGFAVSADGYIMTNNHVIEGCQEVAIQVDGRAIQVDIVTYDLQNDLALLKGDFTPRNVFALSDDQPELLQDIYVAGYPFGNSFSSSIKVTKGIISSLAGVGNNFSNIQIDAALQVGNSGGPILDERGNVVGVAVSKLDAQYMFENFGLIPENTNFGIKTSVVRSILASHSVSTPPANQSDITRSELGSMISGGTYYVSCMMTLAQIERFGTEKVMFENLQ